MIKYLLLLGCWIAMEHVAYIMLGIMTGIRIVMRYRPWIDPDLIRKACDMATDNLIGVNWGTNKHIRFVGENILERIGWPIAFIADMSDIVKDSMRFYGELINEEGA